MQENLSAIEIIWESHQNLTHCSFTQTSQPTNQPTDKGAAERVSDNSDGATQQQTSQPTKSGAAALKCFSYWMGRQDAMHQIWDQRNLSDDTPVNFGVT